MFTFIEKSNVIFRSFGEITLRITHVGHLDEKKSLTEKIDDLNLPSAANREDKQTTDNNQIEDISEEIVLNRNMKMENNEQALDVQ